MARGTLSSFSLVEHLGYPAEATLAWLKATRNTPKRIVSSFAFVGWANPTWLKRLRIRLSVLSFNCGLEQTSRAHPPAAVSFKLSCRPPSPSNEQELHWYPQNQCRRRFPSERNAGPGCVDVCRRDSQEKDYQTKARSTAKARHQHTHGAGNLTESREIDHSARPRNPRRGHSNKISPHRGKVGGGGEEEHDGQCISGRCVP